MSAQSVDNPFYSRYIVVLGNNKGNKTFPAVLPEQAYSSCESAGFGECLFFRKAAFEFGIIGFKVEISYPF